MTGSRSISAKAKDEAKFLTAFTNGALFDRNFLGAGEPSGCSGPLVYVGNGAGDSFKSDVVYAVDDRRVAVLSSTV
jgi:hypothetical protein